MIRKAAFRVKYWLPALVAVTVAGAAATEAGMIDVSLEQRMTSAAADELLPVVLRVSGTITGSSLKADLASRYTTRRDRHREAVVRLRATAKENQPAILDALRGQYYADRVFDLRGFWIDNIITARMTPSAIAEAASLGGIDEIALMPDPSLIRPLALSVTPDATATLSTQSGLRAIKADSLWATGYTGSGRLVGSLDTGVDGGHKFLSSKWRGHNGYSVAESWHDPVYGDSVPTAYEFDAVARNHGTQVMGIMVAADPAWPDTFGVCPDCQWMSAAAISVPCPSAPYLSCSNLFEALQWIADPDGDPNTETDVPDAIVNPWGIPQWFWHEYAGWIQTFVGCDDVLFNVIDNIEAAGAAMVFAAGNEGDAFYPMIRNPANRATTETNAFAVGMVNTNIDPTTPPVNPLSSRGPSDCDGVSIKPEVVAPGVNVRTILPDNRVDPVFSPSAYGTSFSAAHVAAGIALLREYNPNATVDEVKTALLHSARDLGMPGPDNAYGHGMLDLMEAMRQLPANTEPSLTIKRDYYTRPAPGTTTQMVVVLRSSGTPATGIRVDLLSEDPRVTISDGSATFADMPDIGDTAGNFTTPFVLNVSPDVLPGMRLPARFEITADGGYARTVRGAIQVGPAQTEDLFTHDAGNFRMTVAAVGSFGHQIDGLAPRPEGEGYFFGMDPTQSLFEGAFLVGTDAQHVSDNARTSEIVPDADFRVDPGGRLSIADPAAYHDEETRAAFTDAWAENPLGLFVEQRTWVDDDPVTGNCLMVEYTIHNHSGKLLWNVHAGLFFDWDFPWSGMVASRDGGGFDPVSGVGWMRHRDEARFRGLAVVSPQGVSSYRHLDQIEEVFDADGLSEEDKWNAMSRGFEQTSPPFLGDGAQLIAAGPFTILQGDWETVAFAIIGGTTLAEITTAADDARSRYTPPPRFVEIDIMPEQCPNVLDLRLQELRSPIRPASSGTGTVLTVAVVGSEAFDVVDIDPATCRFEGVELVSYHYEDLTSPVILRETLCECPEMGRDGRTDLIVDFAQDVVLAALAPITDGETRMTALTAMSRQGRFIQAENCLKVYSSTSTGLLAGAATPGQIAVRNFPNPFNARTEVVYTVPRAGRAVVTVYDVLGRTVRTLVDDHRGKGTYSEGWDGCDDAGRHVASGLYFCRLETGGVAATAKLILLK